MTDPDRQGKTMFTRLIAGLLVMGTFLAGWLAAAAPALGMSEEGQEAPDLNPLTWRSDLAIWTAVVFLVLFAVLWIFAWGPIARGLRKREQRIGDEIASAERSNAEARQLLDEYQKKLAASGDEIQQMLENARREAEKAGQKIVEKARTDAEAEHQRMLGEIELATAGALKELAERSATLAVELAGKIVAQELDPKAHSQLIRQTVDRFSKPQVEDN